jgi:cell division protein FtsI/penicillin-binding protein 2
MKNKRVSSSKIFLFLHLSFLFIISSFTIYKLYEVQVIKAKEIETFYKNNVKIIPPLRGNIYLKSKDGSLIPAALSFYLYDVYYNPKRAKNIEKEIEEISKILNKNKEEVLSKVLSSKTSLILEKNVDEKVKEKLRKLNLDSLFFEEKVARSYPLKNLLSQTIGFSVYEENEKITKGLYGLEKYYDEYLRGEKGYISSYGTYKPPQRGADLILNIDYYLQVKTDAILEEAIKNFKAEGGLILIMEAETGNILAISEKPDFDLNNYSSVNDYSIYLSKLSFPYEPGSVMKPFFYAGAFEEKILSPTSTYFDQGFVTLNNKTIYNFDKKGRGEVDLRNALVHSLNTGSVYVSQVLGKSRFLKYIEKFRFNKMPEVDFPILNSNELKTLYPPMGREINFGTASFGQGISILPFSLLNGYQILFLNKSTKINIVSEIDFPQKEKIINNQKVISKNILSQETILNIKEILESVVEEQAKKAKIKGFRIGGKTGSALIPTKEGYSEDVITTFIGVFPLSHPKFIVLVRLDKPDRGLLAFGTAAPTFKKVAEFLINYYNLEPDKPEELTSKF